MKWWDSLPVKIQQMLMVYASIGTGNIPMIFSSSGNSPWPQQDERLQGKLACAYLELQQFFS
jgi:hypothetical protein